MRSFCTTLIYRNLRQANKSSINHKEIKSRQLKKTINHKEIDFKAISVYLHFYYFLKKENLHMDRMDVLANFYLKN